MMNVFESKSKRAKEKSKSTQSMCTICKSKSDNANAHYYFKDFTENVGVAGLKYLGEEGRSLIERIFWLIILTIAIILSILLVYKTFVKWQTSPVIVTFATEQKSIYEIPFPAVTICPEIKTKKETLNFTDIYLRKSKEMVLNEEDTFQYDTLSLICDQMFTNENDSITSDRAIELMYQVKPEYYGAIGDCIWKGNPFDEGAYFIPILTSEGICYTFNGYRASEIFTDKVKFPHKNLWNHEHEHYSGWTIEGGYNKNWSIDAYPWRTPMVGENGGFRMTLSGKLSDMDYSCKMFPNGFKVAIHNPTEFPRINENYFRVPINQAVVVAIKPNLMTTSDDLRGYSPQDRKCYFSHEKKLDYFKAYNRNNCLLECLTKFTLLECNCVNFYMPRNLSTRICGSALQKCTTEAKDKFLISEASKKQVSTSEETKTFSKMDYGISCGCLPSCYSLDFDVEISQADIHSKDIFNVIKASVKDKAELIADTFEKADFFVSTLTIYYKNMEFSANERNELYGYADFWANVGGVFGLFTGFSFITIFEILYYLSLRLTCNVKMFGRRVWSGSPKIRDEFSSNVKGQKDSLDTPL